ncbi:MAG: hypothetical protein QXL91_05565, partial [Candidatus Bathyarchaeia archaeon]
SQIKPALQRAVNSGKPAVLDVRIDREVIPPDFAVLASIWLEGCELPEEEREAVKEAAKIVQL